MAEIEDAPNIGKVLGRRLRAAFPEDACVHTRLALAGAVRGIRWHDLPHAVQAQVTRGLSR